MFAKATAMMPATETTMFCPKCRTQIADGLHFCPECGVSLHGSTQQSTRHTASSSVGTRDEASTGDLVYPKNPPLSPHFAWLTLLLPGLPQLIFGQVAKGIVCCILFFVSFPTGVGPVLILIACVADAYMVGKALKAGKPLKKWQFFPSV